MKDEGASEVKADGGSLGLFPVTAIVIGSIIGSGVFNFMTDMSGGGAGAGASIFAWLISGVGFASLVLVFQNLLRKRPDLDSGIYSYAKEGFGDYMGFNSVWGYWLSLLFSDIALATMMMSALSYFKKFNPVFGSFINGTSLTVPAVVLSSLLLWGMFYLISRGVKEAVTFNTVITVAKLIPLAIFLVIVIVAFKLKIFTTGFWATADGLFSFKDVFQQTKGALLVTIWGFIGVEGAVIFSGRADKKTIARGTMLGFITVLLIYVLVTVLSFGILSQPELAALDNPGMAGVLESIIGTPGAIIVSLGVIISTLGCWYACTLLAYEVTFRAARQGDFPKIFKKENKQGVPINAHFISCLLVQILFVLALVSVKAYRFGYALAAVTILVPYVLSALFQIKVTIGEKAGTGKFKNILIGVVATAFSAFVLFSDMKYFLVMGLLFVPGIAVFYYSRKQNGLKIFKKSDSVVLVLVGVLFIACIVALATGYITIADLTS